MEISFTEGTTHYSEHSAVCAVSQSVQSVSLCHYTVLLKELLTTQNAVQSVQSVSLHSFTIPSPYVCSSFPGEELDLNRLTAAAPVLAPAIPDVHWMMLDLCCCLHPPLHLLSQH